MDTKTVSTKITVYTEGDPYPKARQKGKRNKNMKKDQVLEGKFKFLLILDSIQHKATSVLKHISLNIECIELNVNNILEYCTRSIDTVDDGHNITGTGIISTGNTMSTITTGNIRKNTISTGSNTMSAGIRSTSNNSKQYDQSRTVLIRNFNSLFLAFTKYQVFNMITKLKSNRVIVILHKDIELGQDFKQFLMQDSIIDLTARSLDYNQLLLNNHPLKYTMNPKFTIIDENVEFLQVQQAKPESTFNLELNTKQLKVKQDLELPHYSKRTFQIEYEMDEFDSDPDDDLEI